MQSSTIESKTEQKKPLSLKKRKRGLGIYMQNILYKQVVLPFNNIGINSAELIREMLIKNNEGKCIEEGFVKNNSIRLLKFSAGELKGRNIIFTASFECLICNPVEGQRFKCVVKNITKAGIRAETSEKPSPIVVFIARDHHHNNASFSKLKEGDEINVRVIGTRYELNDQYISVIAEYVEIRKLKKKPTIKIVISEKT